MTEEARPAGADDLGAIVALAGVLRDELRPMRGGDLWSVREARPGSLREAYRALLDDPGSPLVVGLVDGVVIGFGAGHVEHLQDGRRHGVVDELFVEPEARAVGVGEAMLGLLVGHFSAAGCTGIDAWALPGHRAAKNFFEESGFKARGIVMHHRLGDGGT